MHDYDIINYLVDLRNDFGLKELDDKCKKKGFSLEIDLFISHSLRTSFIQGSFAICSNKDVLELNDFDSNGYACFTTTLGLIKHKNVILYPPSQNEDLQEQVKKLMIKIDL